MTKNKIIAYAMGPISSAVIGLITLPIITWFYSVDDVGRISMLQLVASLAVLLFCLGLDQAYVREYHEIKNKPQLFKITFLPGLVSLGLVIILLIAIRPELISELLYDIDSVFLGMISLACFMLAFVIRFLSLILRMQERALAYSMSQLLSKALFLLLILSFVWMGTEKDIYSLIAAHVLSVLVVFVVLGWNTREEWRSSIFTKIDKSLLRKHMAFGFPLIIGGLASWGLTFMDKLFLRGMATFAELGVYSVAMSVAGVATVLSGVFNTIWAPMVFKWIGEDDQVQIDKIDDISEHLLSAIFFIIVLSGCFSWLLPFFLPKEYSATQFLITACLLGPLLYTLSETTAIGITIARRTSFSMLASIGAMLMNVLGNYLLVPSMGAAGAAISTAVAFSVFYVLRTEFSRLVWRKIPRFKSYLVLLYMLLATLGSLVMQNASATVAIWLAILVSGGFIFRPSIILALRYIRHGAHNG
ncbi:oligosaccharide flippase family protein [Pseudomonas stutzeri]|uniref:Polysaccharide biosynthesis protein n=1 Tax=Stutzerimonas stutzeri TaxID=316 RepID=A0A2N8T112_STUST|nr:oligosaccharide flippase family protein [Stutzerimonas stutzeri]MCQ4251914.1 oligosaccharide flippase family protein [Stutzerimonas stutzeri]PNG08427.1 polysaccharide biosynthesis protein [Stutzerimonas stutzeri]